VARACSIGDVERGPRETRPKLVEIDMSELEKILEQISSSRALPPEDLQKLRALVESYEWLQGEITRKGASIGRLQKLFFGTPSTEKTSQVLGESAKEAAQEGADEKEDPPQAPSDAAKPASAAKGHGRNGAGAYAGAQRVSVPHETLKAGDPCPQNGCEGKLYRLPQPRVLVCVKGHVPLQATVFEREALRCALCGKVFVAGLPEGVHSCKYDPTAIAMIGLLKYGTGMPFYRLGGLQEDLGIPLPAATQWEVVRDGAKALGPAYEELVRQAAQGEVLHNDDTPMKILSHLKENEERKKEKERTGTFTTGIVAQAGLHRIALFFTGRKHAGENLTRVLLEREGQRGPPIQMCDALDRNLPQKPIKTILANCLSHGRRNFVDVVASFPQEVRYVLEALRDVFRHDARAREEKMSPLERLLYHQEHSGPVMKSLKAWMEDQIAQKNVEPHSGLGEAIGYMLKRWEPLSLFLREPGAPLENNITERALKKAILHRKNALFFKSENGADVGDVFMTLVHTAELSGINPFDYLTELLRHPREVADAADAWLPWNYRQTVECLRRPAAG
jgi:transposase